MRVNNRHQIKLCKKFSIVLITEAHSSSLCYYCHSFPFPFVLILFLKKTCKNMVTSFSTFLFLLARNQAWAPGIVTFPSSFPSILLGEEMLLPQPGAPNKNRFHSFHLLFTIFFLCLLLFAFSLMLLALPLSPSYAGKRKTGSDYTSNKPIIPPSCCQSSVLLCII